MAGPKKFTSIDRISNSPLRLSDSNNGKRLTPLGDSDIQRLVLISSNDRLNTAKDKPNVSISITDASSPDGSIKKEWRAVHSRSNSDVTPKCACPSSPAPPRALPSRRPHPRSHSLGARPGQKQHTVKPPSLSIPTQRSSVTNLAVEFSPHVEISTLSSILAKCEKNLSPKCSPRKISSERTSPNVSVISIPDANPLLLKVGPMLSDNKSTSQLVYVPSDPWTKMTECDYKTGGKLGRINHLSLDYSTAENGPWVLHDALKENSQSRQRLYRKSKSLSKQKTSFDGKKLESPTTLQISNSNNPQLKFDRFSSLMTCDICWSTECKCLQSNGNRVFKTSPTLSTEKQLDALSIHASPSRLSAERMYGVGKKSPVFARNQPRTSSINLIKCSHDTDKSEDINDLICVCNKPALAISPKPSPRHSSPRINYKTLPVENNSEESDRMETKEIPNKTVLDIIKSEVTSSEIVPVKSISVNPSEWNGPKAANKDHALKPVDACDPLLETTC